MAVLTLQDMVRARDEIPWRALQLLTGDVIYGGRVTNEWDQKCLTLLLKKFYCEDVLGDMYRCMDCEVRLSYRVFSV